MTPRQAEQAAEALLAAEQRRRADAQSARARQRAAYRAGVLAGLGGVAAAWMLAAAEVLGPVPLVLAVALGLHIAFVRRELRRRLQASASTEGSAPR